MPVKHCCYGNCNSDSRYVEKRPDTMGNVVFIPFPKPKTQRSKCERWVRLCGRKFFTVDNVRKETYICSKHFVGGNGPTDSHPDPLPAVSTEFERKLLSSKKKRKPPGTRLSSHQKTIVTPHPGKRRKLFDDTSDVGLPLADHAYSRPSTDHTCIDQHADIPCIHVQDDPNIDGTCTETCNISGMYE